MECGSEFDNKKISLFFSFINFFGEFPDSFDMVEVMSGAESFELFLYKLLSIEDDLLIHRR